MKTWLTLIIFIISSTLITKAQESSLPLQHRGGVLVNTLLSQGVTQIGDMNLREFKEAIEGVEYRSMDEGQREGWESRRDAYYLVDESTVYSRPEYQFESEVGMNLFGNHEAAGAAGYCDKNYELTLTMATITVLPAYQQQAMINSAYAREVFSSDNIYASNGGCTGIGGGGELEVAFLKYKIVKGTISRFISNRNQNSERDGRSTINIKMITRMIDASIEPYDLIDGEVARAFIGIKENNADLFKSVSKDNSHVYYLDQPTIFVPRNLYSLERDELEMIEKQAEKLLISYVQNSQQLLSNFGIGRVVEECPYKKLLMSKKLYTQLNFYDELRKVKSQFRNLCR